MENKLDIKRKKHAAGNWYALALKDEELKDLGYNQKWLGYAAWIGPDNGEIVWEHDITGINDPLFFMTWKEALEHMKKYIKNNLQYLKECLDANFTGE